MSIMVRRSPFSKPIGPSCKIAPTNPLRSTTPRRHPAIFTTCTRFVAKARQNLNQNHWDYIVGGAETETTLRRNRMALDTIAFRPRVLRDVSKVDARSSSSAASCACR